MRRGSGVRRREGIPSQRRGDAGAGPVPQGRRCRWNGTRYGLSLGLPSMISSSGMSSSCGRAFPRVTRGQRSFANCKPTEEFVSRSALQLVRSVPDGVTGRSVVSGEHFQLLNEALWAPDAIFIIVAFAPVPDVYYGGQAEVVYLDGRPPVVLTTFAQQMKWGP